MKNRLGDRGSPVWLFVYRELLRCYPSEIRRQTERDMLETFDDMTQAELRSRGRVGLAVFLVRAYAELPFKALAARSALRVGSPHLQSGPGGYSGAKGSARSRGTITRLLDYILQDIRFALRTLRKRPMYATVTIATLGLGIGAATAMFSVVDAVLLKPLPYEEPDRLVSIWQTMPSWEGQTGPEGRLWDRARLTYLQYRDLSEESTLYDDIAAYWAGSTGGVTLTGVGDAVDLRAGVATVSLLPLLGVRPFLGRWFLPGEEASRGGDGASVVVVSHEFWDVRLGGSSEALGRNITIDDRTFSIVGVLPPGFRIHWLSASLVGDEDPGRRDVWFPVGAPGWGAARGSYAWETIGRLTSGITIRQAHTETSTILSEHPDTEGDVRVLERAGEETLGLASPLVLLFGATILLLLIACGNIATLSMAEMLGRRHEFATRSALGAAQTRLIRLLATESLLLAGLGSILGAVLAYGGTQLLVVVAPPIPRITEVGVDLRVLAFAVLTGAIAGLASGIMPSLWISHDTTRSTMRDAERVSERRRLFSSIVIAFEISMTAVLLVAGGLLTRSLSRLTAVDPGFDTHELATVEVSLPRTRYQTPEARAEFFEEVLGELENIPGIGKVSGANSLPFPGRTAGWGVRVPGRDPEFVGVPFGYHVAPGYLETLGVPLLAGRRLNDSDGPAAPLAVVINETMARRYWRNDSPIGARFFYPWSDEPITVVGIVGDVKKQVLHEDAEPTFYIPFSQHPWDRICFVSRTDLEVQSVVPLMQQAVWSVDSELAVTNATSVAALIAQSTERERYRTMLMNMFGVLAALLAATGVFGITARSVARRTREMGIRMALGARESGLVGTTVRGSLVTALAGTAVGLVGALWVSRFLSRLLFGIEPSDPATYLGAAALVIAVCLLASYAPARRISRVNPVEVLKAE